jgi:23S rRNA (cytidine2498-2'-O)-methyltransferase
MRGFVTVLGAEPALARELGPAGAEGPRWPALVGARASAPVRDPIFSLQQLPDVVHVRAGSVRALAEAAHAAIVERLEAEVGPFSLHAFVPDPVAYRSLAGRAALVGQTFLDHLKERRRRTFRSHVPWPEAPAFPEVRLVQLALVGRGSLLASLARPERLPEGGFDLAPWPGGRAPVPEDRAAPSRAYRKLVEAFAWMQAAPAAGERCIDLGGSPGGWAWTALQRGASVLAVDRSPLQPPAAGHPGLTALTGDAFSYRPAQPVDWLLCDVICRPERTVELCDAWMAAGWCRRLVATLKLKGRDDDAQIPTLRRRLARHGWPYLRLKHLAHHHNEVAVMARREPGEA